MEQQGSPVDPIRQGELGATVVELCFMLASAVLLLSSALTGVVSHSAQRRVHAEQILAMSACRNTLELLRSVDIATLPSLNSTGFDVPGQNGQPRGLSPLPGDSDGLPGEISIRPERSAAGFVLYLVQVRVRWQGGTRGGDFAMQSLMGDRR